jgi:NitT/TauT family transport system substrate-binding protein
MDRIGEIRKTRMWRRFIHPAGRLASNGNIAVFAAAVVVAFGVASMSALHAQEASLATVKVAAAVAPIRAPIDIGVERGFFAAEKIAIEYVPIQSGPDQMPLLASGRVDVTLTGPAATHFNALTANVPVKFMASCGNSSSDGKWANLMLTVRKDLIDSGEVKTVKDLAGKRIGIPNKESKAYVDAVVWLEKAGLKLTDVTFVAPMTFPDMLVGITNKAVDAAITIEPFVTLGADRKASTLLTGDNDIMPNRLGCAVIFGQRMVTDRELGRRFLRAWIKGARVYNDAIFKSTGRAEIIKLMTQKYAVKDAAMYDRMAPFPIDPNGRLNLASIDLDLNFYKKHGLLTGDVQTARLVDTTLATEIVKALGEYK